MKNELSFVKKRRQDILADGFVTFELLRSVVVQAELAGIYQDLISPTALLWLAIDFGFASSFPEITLCDHPLAPVYRSPSSTDAEDFLSE